MPWELYFLFLLRYVWTCPLGFVMWNCLTSHTLCLSIWTVFLVRAGYLYNNKISVFILKYLFLPIWHHLLSKVFDAFRKPELIELTREIKLWVSKRTFTHDQRSLVEVQKNLGFIQKMMSHHFHHRNDLSQICIW